jgi:hypothetical protein
MIPSDNQEILTVKIFLGVFNTPGSAQLGFFVDIRKLGSKE